MSELETKIEIRTLTGETTTVSISSNPTIQELKILLKQLFPPATTSPNFHLFFKGTKLSLQSRISGNVISDGEFIVLIPFTKKDKKKAVEPSVIETDHKSSDQCSTSKFAESAWSDMMQDVSRLREREVNENENVSCSHGEFGGADSKAQKDGNMRNDESLFNEEIDEMLNTMLLCGENELDEKGCKWFMQVLDSVNCLSDPKTSDCMLRNGSIRSSADSSCSCLCPSWLKVLLKAFYFLNIYCTFLQVQQKTVTLLSLEKGLNQLRQFGFGIEYADLGNLSLLFPKVIQFIEDETVGRRSNNSITVIKSKVDTECPIKGKKKMSTATVVNAMKKREGAFKKDLCSTVKSLMEKKGSATIKSYSLNDLLLHVNERNNKGTKRSMSEPSGSFVSEVLCNETNNLLPTEMVEHLKAGLGSQGQIVHIEEINGRIANFVEIPTYLSERMQSALKSSGISKLYSHQADSIEASLSRKSVVISTMTSSGKSLCYNLPVVEVLSQDLSACALYLFPTKALAQDQLRALLSMTKGFDVGMNIGIYDGDTSQKDRLWLRDNSRLLITNPDMLHMSIMPFHNQFSQLLSNLRYVVVDEAHAYKGAFGCHVALILRRLRRLCAHVYGSDPSFISCTATSANPCDHVMELASLPTMELIHKDGSPSGPKLFVLWNPPLRMKTENKRTRSNKNSDKVDRTVVGRASPIMEISKIFAEIVQHGLRCIAFCKTRKLSELVLSYTREILQKTAPHLENSIFAYRAGYTAEDRRKIESEFFGGKICGVAATNALELGIDVGHIDVTLHLGFPGSIASLWQQAGRSGRREQSSLAIYVAFEGPLDQYFMKYPQKLFKGAIECCHVDAKNPQVLEQHLACASFELPLNVVHDEKYFGPSLKSSLESLKRKGYVTTDPSRGPTAEIWNYIGHEKLPSHSVSIRAIETEKYKVIDMKNEQLLEEIEESKAFFQVYDGAVYMQQGKTYLVKNLDLSNKIALCQQADLKYYTKTRDYTDVEVVGGQMAYPVKISNIQKPRTSAQSNPCKVTTTWFGFRRICKRSQQVLDTVELSLPSYTYESSAVWISVPQSIKTTVEIDSFRGGLHAAGHALLHVVPLYIICNSSDLASECVNPHDTRYLPERILLYDSHPGGTGISAQVQPIFTELLTAALELLTSCCCSVETGCPNCVQNLSCHEYNEVLHKDAAITIIKGVLELEKSKFREASSSSIN
ncbi:nucleic acid binding,ATP-dependent helicase [Artemisia annua]|uniref:Nucleic acid binding,ATP-dependent helicase n=1 Tax=Artemisia annua TaxID=35608 RepID=A0A2U1NZY6_ARTAN|nr:nucleic acid binding,ATP-dependent helicase [Artemisia annua]